MEIVRKDISSAVRFGVPSDPVTLRAHFGTREPDVYRSVAVRLQADTRAFKRAKLATSLYGAGYVAAYFGAWVGRMVLVAAAILAATQLTGCAIQIPIGNGHAYQNRQIATAETVWQGLHAIDTAQTVTIARSPDCLSETGLNQYFYGTQHPTESRVLATNAALSLGHYYLGGFLDRKAEDASNPDSLWPVLRRSFYISSFITTGLAVYGNSYQSVKPFSTRKC